MGKKWLYNAPIVVFLPSHFSAGKTDYGGKNGSITPERMYVNKHRVFYCSKSKTIHGGTPVQTIMYISITKGLCTIITHRLLFIALFDDFNLIINIFHCLCPSFYLYLSNLLS